MNRSRLDWLVDSAVPKVPCTRKSSRSPTEKGTFEGVSLPQKTICRPGGTDGQIAASLNAPPTAGA